MGAWGIKTFENDDAGDWVWELEESDDLSVIEAALDAAGGEYLESPQGSCILAAAEIILALKGRPRPDLPEEAAGWVAKHKTLDAGQLVSRALQAVDRVLGDQSELKELWQETDDFAAWSEDVHQIRAALAGK